MKQWTAQFVVIAVIAIAAGLLFHWQYPLVKLSASLITLFVLLGVGVWYAATFCLKRFKRNKEPLKQANMETD